LIEAEIDQLKARRGVLDPRQGTTINRRANGSPWANKPRRKAARTLAENRISLEQRRSRFGTRNGLPLANVSQRNAKAMLARRPPTNGPIGRQNRPKQDAEWSE